MFEAVPAGTQLDTEPQGGTTVNELENRYTRKGIVGSNPTPSAKYSYKIRGIVGLENPVNNAAKPFCRQFALSIPIRVSFYRYFCIDGIGYVDQ